MSRELALDQVLTLGRRALDGGGRKIGLLETEWDLSGKCLNPVGVLVRGVPTINAFHKRPRGQVPIYIEILTRCRKCPK